MVSKRANLDMSGPSSGWAVASLLALLGVALASEYLFPQDDGRRKRDAAGWWPRGCSAR